MTYLNCNLGNLAITVIAYLPENVGNIVRVVGSHGLGSWYGFKNKTYIWEVQTASSDSYLVYETAGEKTYKRVGGCPDAFLRRLTPEEVHTFEEYGTLTPEEECYASA